MTVAIFPGSFDPITNGHLKTIKKASKLFDKLYVVVLTNTKKKYLFDEEVRSNLVETSIAQFVGVKNVEVITRTADLTVNVAHEVHANFILRGLRNEADFSYERNIAAINKTQDDTLETVFFLADPEESYISSSMIKELATFGGDISRLVPKKVELLLQQKLGKSQND